jgi:hypothetical protein
MAWEINAHQGRKVPIGEAEKAVIDLADAPKRRSQTPGVRIWFILGRR